MTTPDPFGGESAPSISFKDAPIGTVQTITVTDAAKLVQSRDFDSGDPVYWVPGQTGKKSTLVSDQPVMSAVINGDDEQGDPRSVWAQKPSALYAAIKAAQAAVEPKYRLKPGDKLAIKLIGEEPPKSGRGANKKLYAAKITVGTAPVAPADDPWADTAASTAPAQSSSFDDEPPF